MVAINMNKNLKMNKLLVSLIAVSMSLTAASKDVVVIVPAHPDDLIACLGFCHLARDKYDIHVVDVTHGERGLGPKGLEDGSTKAIRTKEEEAVCASVGATLHWLDEVDGEAYACRETCHQLSKLFDRLKPRAVIAHWPVDIHTDHVMSGAIALRATFLAKLTPEIYFMEQTYQSKRFVPDIMVDFSSVYDKVWESLRLYKCQYRDGGMERRRRCSADFYGQHTMRFNQAKCEGFMSFSPVMQGEKTIFSELPHPDGGQRTVFQGVRDFVNYFTGRDTDDAKIAADQAYTHRWMKEQSGL